MALHTHRCLNHAEREAAARCPACRQFFCRECVTEHSGRVLCSACLARQARPEATRTFRWGWLINPVLAVVGLTTAWVFFYSLGALLLSLPSEWHEGTIWKQLAPEDSP